MKLLAAILLAGLFASSAQAGPYGKVKNWIKEHPTASKVAVAGATLTLTSIFQWKASTYCERGDPKPCDTGYGAKGNHEFAIFTTATGAALLGASAACWKDEPSWKFCYGLAYGIPAYQTAVGIKDFTSYKPEIDDPTHARNTFNAFRY